MLLFAVAFGSDASVTQPQVGCNPNLLFDASLLFVGDARLPFSSFAEPLSQEALDYTLDFCSDFYRTEYGLHTRKWWTGKANPPPGITVQGYSSFAYRLYGMATPEYQNHFPMTNGKVTDDALLIVFTQKTTLGGAWAMMQMEMGLPATVDAGEWLVCGGYRGYQNDTRGVQKLWPNIRYHSMPMMSMWMGAVGDFSNADTPVMCDLEHEWWGKGVAIGQASVRSTGGVVSANIRNMVTFPMATFDRMGPPRYRRCENTNI